MGDFGVKLALPGVDVASAPDYQLLFSSSWPNPKIFANPTVSIPSGVLLSQQNFVIYTHSLDFVPFVIPYSSFPNGQAEIGTNNIGESNNTLTVDSQSIRLINVFPPSSMGLVIFYLDITQPFTAPTVIAGQSSVSTPDPNWGFKISKDGHSTDESDLRSFILHSSARTPLIHAVVQGIIGASGTFTYIHDLPYNPIFFVYINDASVSSGQYYLANGLSGIGTSGSNITVGGSAGGNVSIVILKDPFIINDNIIKVSI